MNCFVIDPWRNLASTALPRISCGTWWLWQTSCAFLYGKAHTLSCPVQRGRKSGYAPSKNISRKGPRNCRSLGCARDDKGEGYASIESSCLIEAVFHPLGWDRKPHQRFGRDDNSYFARNGIGLLIVKPYFVRLGFDAIVALWCLGGVRSPAPVGSGNRFAGSRRRPSLARS